jgi:hypothetical protein
MTTLQTQEMIDELPTFTAPANGLREAYPWPDERPAVASQINNPGWLGEGTERVIAHELSDQTRLVVELGAWLGMSTRYIADLAPNATVISVDHWEGSPEHRGQAEYESILPSLYQSFLSMCWDYRDRVIPLRMSTLEGLKTIAEHGLEPDLIYIDAEHSFEAVSAELELSHKLFPTARLVGDDYDWQGVQRAVDEFAVRENFVVERVGMRGWKLVDRKPSPVRNGRPRQASKSVVLVPHLNGIEAPCEAGLGDLEKAGVRVIRRQGSSQIDQARSEMVSDALHDGYETILFIDADIGFAATDALRLLSRREPVISGVYAKKGPREVASSFAEDVKQVIFGPTAPGLYPLKFAATGFLRIRSEVLREMVSRLDLPLCNTVWGRGFWPFFLPMVVSQGDGRFHYLGEDWSFSYRLKQIGVTPMADTSFRLWHYGPYGYSWEEAGTEHPRYQSFSLSIG